MKRMQIQSSRWYEYYKNSFCFKTASKKDIFIYTVPYRNTVKLQGTSTDVCWYKSVKKIFRSFHSTYYVYCLMTFHPSCKPFVTGCLWEGFETWWYSGNFMNFLHFLFFWTTWQWPSFRGFLQSWHSGFICILQCIYSACSITMLCINLKKHSAWWVKYCQAIEGDVAILTNNMVKTEYFYDIGYGSL